MTSVSGPGAVRLRVLLCWMPAKSALTRVLENTIMGPSTKERQATAASRDGNLSYQNVPDVFM